MPHIEYEGWNDDEGTIEDVTVDVLGGDLPAGLPMAVVITTPDGAVTDLRLDSHEADQLLRYLGQAIQESNKGEDVAYAFAARLTDEGADEDVSCYDDGAWRRRTTPPIVREFPSEINTSVEGRDPTQE